MNFWQIWSEPDLEVCQDYVRDGFGGTMVSVPCGILNAVMVNVGSVMVLKLTPKLRFKSIYVTQHVTVFLIFILSYLSLGIMVMKRYYNEGLYYLPPDFTKHWLIFYGKMIGTQMIMSNLLQYIGPLLKIGCRRGCCCCKRKGYKLNKNLNQEFSFERRYGTVITTVFTCFTYGFAIPMLFILASVVFIVQFIMDKMLISFYYKERVVHNDLLNRSSLRVIKYAVCVFLYFGGSAMRSNYCTVSNQPGSVSFSTEFLDCRHMWSKVVIMYCAAFVFSFFFIMHDLYSQNICLQTNEGKSLQYKRIPGFNLNYFSRLSNLDRKRWIC